ncbi:hypothetical protein BGZ54_005815 [Gamsiella multidivaricata]|nr:hypothetical protein BGZ54_005815 [Gamsiella multidivaricata]
MQTSTPLQFGDLSITDGHGVDDTESPEAEVAQAKAEYNDAWSRFRELSKSFKNSCEGDAPWTNLPMVTDPRLITRPRNNSLDYQPKVFFVPEKGYLDWIERDGLTHYFHWRRENERIAPQSAKGQYLFWEAWICHRCGKPENKPRKTARQVIRQSQKVGCQAKLYVHKLMTGTVIDPAYETKRHQELVRLTYYFKHEGHVLGDGNDFKYLRISSRMKNKIWDLIDAGLDLRHIRENLMALSGDFWRQLEDQAITRGNFVTSEDVLSLVRSYWELKAERHPTIIISLCLWMVHLESQGFFVFRAQNQRKVEKLDSTGHKSAVGS